MEEQAKPKERFDPSKHLLSLKGKSYLPVYARIAAFRDVHDIDQGWGIRTFQLAGSPAEQFATFHAEITDPEGRVVGSGTKSEDVKGFPDFAEKAETGAIGRALATAGFGTLYATDFDEGSRLADAPVAAPRSRAPAKPTAPAKTGTCATCGKSDVPSGRVAFCRQQGKPLTHFDCN